MTRDTAWGLVLASGVAVVALTVKFPELLGKNSFLNGFASHEVMSFLIVVLTITLASVANIHLNMTETLQRALPDPEARKRVEKIVGSGFRAEINSSAWLLFWAFIGCAIGLLIKGQWDKNIYVLSVVHGFTITIVVLNLLVLRDLYRTIYNMAANPIPTPPKDDQS
jgi:hypothetical protein